MRHLPSMTDKDDFIKASRFIGELLRRNGHKIIICSSHPETVDRFQLKIYPFLQVKIPHYVHILPMRD